MFITPDLRFRVEYYLPYTVNNDQRSFDFLWLADIAVNNFQLKVQRPISASSFNTEPAAIDVTKSGDGFDYYVFSKRAMPTGQLFLIHVDYKMANPRLSIESLASPKANEQTSALPDTSTSALNFNGAIVIIIIGGLFILAALVWHITSRRSSSNTRKSIDPPTAGNQSRTNFCHLCGELVNENDKYCGECGTVL